MIKNKTTIYEILKRFLLIFVPSTTIIAGLLISFLITEKNAHKDILQNNANFQTTLAKDTILKKVFLSISDLIYLQEKIRVLPITDKTKLKNLASELLIFNEIKEKYYKIRIIDNSGLEIVKIVSTKSIPYLAKDIDLYNKAHRYYFKKSKDLEMGDVYITPLDLNVENGKITLPLVPSIRFITKTVNNNLIILTYNAKDLIESLDSILKDKNDNIFLINSEGYFLKGLKRNDEWGFLFGDRKDKTFGNFFPNTWQSINSSDSSFFINNEGLFSFETVYPLEKKLEWEESNRDKKNFFWKIIYYKSNASIAKELKPLYKKYTKLSLLFISLLFAGALFSAIEWEKNELAKKQVTKLSTAVEQSPNIIIITDTDGKIEYVNPQFSKLTGFTHDETIGKKTSILKSGNTPDSVYKNLWETILKGKTWKGELQNRKKNGELYWEFSSIAPIKDKNKKITNFLAVKENITDKRKKKEELKKAKITAEDANKAKSEFLANMSHEIRTPLNGIVGMAEILKETDLNNEQFEYTKIIQSSCDMLLSVINDILDFSKIEAGMFSFDHIAFKLEASIGDTIKALAHKAHEKDIELILDIDADVPKNITGDPTRLRQVIVNLIGNAIKFTQEGEITVKIKVYKEKLSTDSDIKLKFSVKDSGIGIPKDKKDLIFNKFSQADSSHTRKFGGTGLGLTIAKKIVKHMNGKIWVESEINKGSTFFFTAVFKKTKETLVKIEKVSLANLKGIPVLIVDDNTTNLIVLEKILTDIGMNVQKTLSPEKGLKLIQNEKNKGTPFELLITDFQMPNIDGYEFVKKIRADELATKETKKIKIIMLTSGVSRGDEKKCKEYKIDASLTKPLIVSDLTGSLNALLNTPKTKNKELPLITKDTLITDQDTLKTLSILLVEDNQINQILAKTMLKKNGHNIKIAENGLIACKMWEKENFDLILMDIQMPEMDGYAATKIIREKEKEKGSYTPIIAMTAHAQEQDRQRCLDSGMDDYINKPVKSEVLFKTIRIAVDKLNNNQT